MSIIVTEKAIKEIKRVMEDQKLSKEEIALEVGVIAAGCSGFSYTLGFKKKSEIDPLNETICKADDLEAVVHNKALQFISGTSVDFYEGIDKRGFVFNNPLSKGGCGCGNSFRVDESGGCGSGGCGS